MQLVDVNVLLYAFREESDRHKEYKTWIEHAIAEGHLGISELVLSAFIRIATHPKVFTPPTPLHIALEFAEALHSHPDVLIVRPGERHWSIFRELVRDAECKGNLVSDAYHAALSIEHGAEWISTDRDFTRFADLRWSHPLG